MKNILYIVICFLPIICLGQQISGRVVDNNGFALEKVKIHGNGSKVETLSDGEGNFIIPLSENMESIVLSKIGYKNQEITINNRLELGDIVMYEGIELFDIVVKGDRANKFARKETAYVSKMPLRDIENSQVYSTVTTELLESQLVTSLDGALNNASGIVKQWDATARNGDGTGYYALRGFSTKPDLVDGMPGYTFNNVDPSYIERIEVLKGPSATLFGSTYDGLGGLINVVTKKPYKGFGGSFSYTTGSFNTHRLTGDINTPIGKGDKAPYFRLNASYLNKGSFQDQGYIKSLFIAPSLTYSVNDRLDISVGFEYVMPKQTNTTSVFLRRGYELVSHNPDALGINPKASFTDDDIYLENDVLNSRLIADYKLSNQWTSKTAVNYSHSKSDGYYQYLFEGVPVAFLNPNPQTPQEIDMNTYLEQLLQTEFFTRVLEKIDSKKGRLNFQQNFLGDFKLGEVRNRIVFGLDYISEKDTDKSKNFDPSTGFPILYGLYSPDGSPVDNFITPTVETEYPINQSILESMFQAIPNIEKHARSNRYAVYASNVINFSPQLNVMIGLRYDYIDQDGNTAVEDDDFEKDRLSPKFGVVYQPVLNKLSLFANYQTGFIFNNNRLVQGKITVIEPTVSKQFEFGTKYNLIKNKLNIGLSYYHINATNRGTLDPYSMFNIAILDEVVSSGLEFELKANPLHGLNIIASYAYNHNEIKDKKFPTYDGRRSYEAGPAHIYNVWADYKFNDNSFLNNFGLGGGFHGVSDYATTNNGVSGQFIIPANTLYQATIYYDAPKFRVSLKGNNLLNEVYYKGWSTLTPQEPRSFLGSIMYKF
ncbi:MAG: TonB-dependent receptor domain-containing protein [Weeksellaceae bacterium]